MKGIIHINPAPLQRAGLNAKFYPLDYWQKIVNEFDFKWYQLGRNGINFGDKVINNVIPLFDIPLKQIVKECENAVIVTIDSFLPHLLHDKPTKFKPIVIYTRSDPDIFGYKENINLIKDRKFLRSDQWDKWESIEYNNEANIEPEKVIKEIYKITKVQ